MKQPFTEKGIRDAWCHPRELAVAQPLHACSHSRSGSALTSPVPMPSALSIIVRRWFTQRHFYAGVAIPCFAVFIMLIGGFRNLMILLHESRTTATVTAIHSNGGRSSLHYRYEVNGHTYTGTGGPDHQSFTPPFAVGDTFDVRYSSWLPFFSTAQNPVTIFGQFAVGCLFFLWADFMVTRNAKIKESNGKAIDMLK